MLTEQQQQQQPRNSALANRSFLYRSSAAPASSGSSSVGNQPTSSTTSCLIDETIVYATLDSLALSSSLPLPLTRQQRLSTPLKSPIEEPAQVEGRTERAATRPDGGVYTLPGAIGKKPLAPDKSKDKEQARFAFAKNVLHYVPVQSRRYYRKSRQLASKSLSLGSLGRGPPRHELKYTSISPPSNFVHVDSGSRYLGHADEPPPPRPAGSRYAEIALDSSIFLIDSSFVWRQLNQLKEARRPPDDADYDDVGPSPLDLARPSTETQHCKAAEVASAELLEELQPEEEQEVYDDVGPAPISQARDEEAQAARDDDSEDGLYDDVGPLRDDRDQEGHSEERDPRLGEEGEEEDVYDDVGPPSYPCAQLERQSQPRQSHERVNSLYAGSVHLAYDEPHQGRVDSEWEDLDEPNQAADAPRPASVPGPEPAAKKKHGAGPRWSCKIRRQRSKASGKSSARSTSRSSRTRGGGDQSSRAATWTRLELHEHVAVSLGTGSILLLGSLGQDSSPTQNNDAATTTPLRHNSHDGDEEIEGKGLLQLRVVLIDEEARQVHETSLYVAEDSSDDSNYESLQTYEPDDFSSSSSSSDEDNCDAAAEQQRQQQQQPAPTRPIPPPPREESLSLGHTLGRRMKMLRRTWSITKGSLGRMRRRSSDDNSQPATAPAGQYDPRKYLSSLKKPFAKSQRREQAQGSSSTFYLDKSLSSEGGSSEIGSASSGNENEPIYGNANWYKEAGLYGCGRRSADEPRAPEGGSARPAPAASQPCRGAPPLSDHYSALAEEPLYQFYAANATRVAFESDSDGYEEVEELTPSSATTDLAGPGHRTLWCQTPRVISSGLLQRLTMEERRIQEAKFEIVTSEASYLNSLRVLENEFASNYELTQAILTGPERDKLFGGVPEVLVASERFLAELEAIWREDPMLAKLAELLLKHADRCAGVYVDYCSNQVDVDATLKQLRASKGYGFLEAVSKIEMQPVCHSLSLHSFLMLPMQRITRLPLLADAVLSKLSVEHGERLSWERALAELSQIVARCNEAARLAERRNEMGALARRLEYPGKVPAVELRDRELIRSGTVVQLSGKADTEYKLTFGKKFHKTPLMLMLLTDYLLVTKLRSNSNEETYSVLETCKRSLVALESAPEDGGPLSGRHAMLLTLLENQAGRQVELVISCESDTERERWLDAVSPPKPSCLGETLYESWDCPQVMAVYSYSARQPDELALQPGDVINVLRKMNDGWLFGEKLLDGEQGWFPGNFTKEVASEHVRARNLRQRHRFLALSGSVLQRKAKQSLSLL